MLNISLAVQAISSDFI